MTTQYALVLPLIPVSYAAEWTALVQNGSSTPKGRPCLNKFGTISLAEFEKHGAQPIDFSLGSYSADTLRPGRDIVASDIEQTEASTVDNLSMEMLENSVSKISQRQAGELEFEVELVTLRLESKRAESRDAMDASRAFAERNAWENEFNVDPVAGQQLDVDLDCAMSYDSAKSRDGLSGQKARAENEVKDVAAHLVSQSGSMGYTPCCR